MALDWDYSNTEYTPDSIIATSGRRIQWKCHVCGQTWKAVIRDRTVGGNGCPYCSGKRVNPGVTDLETVYPEIAKEWDYHRNGEVTPDSVLPKSNKYAYWICSNGHSYRTKISSRTQMGVNCPICSGHKVQKGFNDLATVNPQLAEEWDYQINNDLKPTDVTICSGKKVSWICKEGHRFTARISTRTSMHTGCPYCSGKKAVIGKTDFVTLFPDVAKEWDFTKNSLKPRALRPGSSRIVWWICNECGEEWEASINERCKGHKKCPKCNHLLIKK